MNLDLNIQIARSCDQFGHLGSPKNATFDCVLALYFCPLVLGHPVCAASPVLKKLLNGCDEPYMYRIYYSMMKICFYVFLIETFQRKIV